MYVDICPILTSKLLKNGKLQIKPLSSSVTLSYLSRAIATTGAGQSLAALAAIDHVYNNTVCADINLIEPHHR